MKRSLILQAMCSLTLLTTLTLSCSKAKNDDRSARRDASPEDAGTAKDLSGSSTEEATEEGGQGQPTDASGRDNSEGLPSPASDAGLELDAASSEQADEGSGGVEFCPLLDGGPPIDFDGDQFADACDPDDDNDGFRDEDDPKPLDPNIPAYVPTPEDILLNADVAEAVGQIREAGYDFPTHTELEPPDLTGYYLKPTVTGAFPISATGPDQRYEVGGEIRRTQAANLELTTAVVFYDDSIPIGFSVSKDTPIRGSGNQYSIYSSTKGTCTEGGSDWTQYIIGIESGEVDPDTGTLTNVTRLSVTLETQGTLTSVCKARRVGGDEEPGGWYLATVPEIAKVAPDQLNYMCISNEVAYIPEETWTLPDGQTCNCGTDYALMCSPNQ